jgi:hypothetical protein
MELTEIRNRVMNITGHLDVDYIDAEINMVQRQYIQLVARIPGEVTHTTSEDNEELDVAADIAGDVYLFNFIRDITLNNRGALVPLLKDSDASAYGARYHNGKLALLGVGEGRKLLIAYYKRLADIGEGAGEVIVPEIPEQWHDLYWLGAAAMINPERYYALFQDRLRDFKLERISESRPHGQRQKVRGWW